MDPAALILRQASETATDLATTTIDVVTQTAEIIIVTVTANATAGNATVVDDKNWLAHSLSGSFYGLGIFLYVIMLLALGYILLVFPALFMGYTFHSASNGGPQLVFPGEAFWIPSLTFMAIFYGLALAFVASAYDYSFFRICIISQLLNWILTLGICSLVWLGLLAVWLWRGGLSTLPSLISGISFGGWLRMPGWMKRKKAPAADMEQAGAGAGAYELSPDEEDEEEGSEAGDEADGLYKKSSEGVTH